MFNKLLKKHLKNEKGLTLIELLVVVVILGIISAIAIVSIGGIIDNTKKDAHVANAQQMVNAAKMWVTGNANGTAFTGNSKDLKLSEIYSEKLIDKMVDPDTKSTTSYNDDTSKVTIAKNGSEFTYTVTLIGNKKKITTKTPNQLDRSAVDDIPAGS